MTNLIKHPEGLVAALENEVENGTNKQFAQYLLDEFVDGDN